MLWTKERCAYATSGAPSPLKSAAVTACGFRPTSYPVHVANRRPSPGWPPPAVGVATARAGRPTGDRVAREPDHERHRRSDCESASDHPPRRVVHPPTSFAGAKCRPADHPEDASAPQAGPIGPRLGGLPGPRSHQGIRAARRRRSLRNCWIRVQIRPSGLPGRSLAWCFEGCGRMGMSEARGGAE